MTFTYDYYFVPEGRIRGDGPLENNEIWLAAGEYIGAGVFDHHNCGGRYASTVDILLREVNLLEKTREALVEGQPVRIFLHANPNINSLFSCFLLEYYLDHGKEAFSSRFIGTDTGDVIAWYVNNICAGKRKNINGATLYNLVCNLDLNDIKNHWSTSNQADLSNRMIGEALGWVSKAVESVERDAGFNLYDWVFPVDEGDIVAQKIVDKLEDIGRRDYGRDKREGRLVIKNIPIWTKDGRVETVKAAIWNDIPSSPNSAYLHARQEGAVITFAPHSDYGGQGARISINPNLEGAVGKYSLFEVAEILEQMEQVYDKKEKEKPGG